jgi:hypothetical protein
VAEPILFDNCNDFLRVAIVMVFACRADGSGKWLTIANLPWQVAWLRHYPGDDM